MTTQILSCPRFNLISSYCDAENTFYHHASVQNKGRVGHILNLTVAGTDLEPDLKVWDPLDPCKELRVAAIVESIRWNGQSSNPISMNIKLSAKNKNNLLEIFYSGMGKQDWELQWAVYEFDFHENRYFRSFHTDDKRISMEIEEDAEVEISESPDRSIKNPSVFSIYFQLIADRTNGPQELYLAASASGKTFARQIR